MSGRKAIFNKRLKPDRAHAYGNKIIQEKERERFIGGVAEFRLRKGWGPGEGPDGSIEGDPLGVKRKLDEIDASLPPPKRTKTDAGQLHFAYEWWMSDSNLKKWSVEPMEQYLASVDCHLVEFNHGKKSKETIRKTHIPGDRVHGVLMKIDQEQFNFLSAKMSGYDTTMVEAETYDGKKKVLAKAFQSMKVRQGTLPSKKVVEKMKKAAAERGLKSDYQEFLGKVRFL